MSRTREEKRELKQRVRDELGRDLNYDRGRRFGDQLPLVIPDFPTAGQQFECSFEGQGDTCDHCFATCQRPDPYHG